MLGRQWHQETVYGVAIRGYIATPRSNEPWITSHLELRSPEGEVLPGYGWIFPLGNGEVNIGVGALATSKRPADAALRPLMSYYTSLRREEWGFAGEPRAGLSALLPMGGAVSGVAGPNWMLIGDAAACVNPLNGEGIDYAVPSDPPVASAVTCRTGCGSLTTARPGSTIRVLGSQLQAVTQVVFTGGKGSADDVSAPATVVDATHVQAVVPQGARSGRIQLVNADGVVSRVTRKSLRVRNAISTGALAARVAQRRVLFDGTNRATLDLYGGTASDSGVSIDLLHEPDGVVVAHWDVAAIPAGTVQSITWDATVNGKPAPEGRYEFHVAQTQTDSAVRAATAPAGRGQLPVPRPHVPGARRPHLRRRLRRGPQRPHTRGRRHHGRTAARRWSRPAAAS